MGSREHSDFGYYHGIDRHIISVCLMLSYGIFFIKELKASLEPNKALFLW